MVVAGGRGIITGAEPSGGNASPPGVWWSGLCGGGPPLGSVGSVATGCTAADMDRSTPPNSTGRHPPEPGPLLTAGRIPPPPGSGAYGKNVSLQSGRRKNLEKTRGSNVDLSRSVQAFAATIIKNFNGQARTDEVAVQLVDCEEEEEEEEEEELTHCIDVDK
ncbi:hypothetical protein WN51_12030 [Melipona quadrifasciata]|uniref:Uncharacterized protein n=1 Tax=Melipona quadrifasciata TaxID=166423 RepID=A0A0M9A4E3_9HYME|nr:hypothetical protein WN51_12030 [Melipona quadrifasciata]